MTVEIQEYKYIQAQEIKGVLEIPCQPDKITSRTDNERRIRI
jgi:hypothetical protein